MSSFMGSLIQGYYSTGVPPTFYVSWTQDDRSMGFYLLPDLDTEASSDSATALGTALAAYSGVTDVVVNEVTDSSAQIYP